VRLTVWPIVVLAVLGLGDVGRFLLHAAASTDATLIRAGLGLALVTVSFFAIAAIDIVPAVAADVIRTRQAERQRGDYAFHVFLQHKALSDRRRNDAIPEPLGQLSQRPPAGAVRRGDPLEIEGL
jgi:hypothetical protein